jgi:hypothetical protein
MKVTVKHYAKNNKSLVDVPLGRGGFATIEEKDFNELMKLGVSPVWRVKDDTICVSVGRNSIPIGRILLSLDKGQCLRYLDHDSKNLVRSNLVVKNGMSKYNARDMLTDEFKNHRHEIIHEYEKPSAKKPMSAETRRLMESRDLY